VRATSKFWSYRAGTGVVWDLEDCTIEAQAAGGQQYCGSGGFSCTV
tara:strand:- start:4128 stop:4265 length:138 start_codon:yes stop_codon:yes gene_type:complete